MAQNWTEPQLDFVDECNLLRADQHQKFDRVSIENLFCGTGEQDHTPVMGGVTTRGELRSLLLAMGDHRPWRGDNTLEQLKSILGERFRVRQLQYDNGDYVVSRVM